MRREPVSSSGQVGGEIAFSWYGMPQYAARAIRAAIERLGRECVVIGSPPHVPVEGMEAALGQPIRWIDGGRPTSWAALGLEPPATFFQSGWAYPGFNALGREVKRRGGRVVGICDTNWRGDLRQLVLGPVAFRLLHRRRFDAVIVPGAQSTRMMRYFGMPATRIHYGMDGADPTLFGGGAPLPTRPRTFLFVGQFIARKDVVGLARAFARFAERRPDWSLSMIGGGEQEALIPRHPRIAVEPFVQPEALAERYRQARFFVLPSHVEAWGLVVHEATLSGCGLVLSHAVGSGDDLATADNAVRFRAGDEDDLLRALHEAADWDDRRLVQAEAASRDVARQFGPARFADAVCAEVGTCA